MKKTKLINSEISYEIAKMGHFDKMAIADSGLPIPQGVKRIDLAVTAGVPGFMEVLEAVLSELIVQKVTIASEMREMNPVLYKSLSEMMLNERTVLEEIPHDEFKKRTNSVVAVVRTGEARPYANIILESNVVF